MNNMQTPSHVGLLLGKHYAVDDLLGKGPSGAVYLVRDERHHHIRFALKEVMSTEHKERFGFFFYARVLKRLKHAALPRIYQVFRNDTHDRVYIVMDYVEGQTLEAVQQAMAGKRFSLPEAMTCMSPIIDAVSYLHRQQPPLIHGDIKPTNIIMPKSGTPSVLVDFGGSKKLRSDSSAHQRTLNYRAPEQYSEGASPHTDVYALGAIFYTLLTGTVPAAASDRLVRLSEKKPDPLMPVQQIAPYVRTTVAQAIHCALSIHSHDRFATVEQFWEALWQVIGANTMKSPVPELMVVVPTEEFRDPDADAMDSQAREPVITATIEEHTELDTDSMLAQRAEPEVTVPEVENSTAIANPTVKVEKESVDASSEPALSTAAILVEGKLPDKAPLHKRSPVHRFKNRGVSLLLFLALLVSIGLGSGFLSMVGRHLPPTTAPLSARQSRVTPGHISRGTATPVKVSSPYPNVARPYNGTIHDISDGVSTKMSLTAIQQQQRNIRGYFSGLFRNSPFTGTVSTDGHIHFIVPGRGQQSTLSFDGNMQSDGNLGGTYCSPVQVAQCSNYGVWSVSPNP